MTPRIGSVPKAIALVPLAALSAAWTVQVVRTPVADTAAITGQRSPGPQASSTTSAPPPALPETPLVVPSAPQAPGSVWGDAVTPAVPPLSIARAAVAAPTIPTVALAAYQRAAAVMDTADQACHLDWSLIAGIGRVESDHGSHAGSRLSPDGHATPGIVGPALTGAAGTLAVPDTDGGVLDGDAQFDHAVGPMQFLPSTWSTVGVDGDGDGQRNPQDIDDAALAAGVYLCSGAEDLASSAGQQAALLRYNNSTSYVATVLTFATQYGAETGAVEQVPFVSSVAVIPGVVLTPQAGPSEEKPRKRRKRHAHTFVGVSEASTSSAHHAAAGGPKGPAVTAPGPSDGPTDPGTTPPPAVPATDAQLTQLCGPRITDRYPAAVDDPAASDDLYDRALAACLAALHGKPLEAAEAELDDVLDGLPDTLPALTATEEPAPSPEPTPEPDPEHTPDPAEQPNPTSTASTAPEAATETAGETPAG